MAESVLILGPSGSGKSHSLKFLDPKKTFLINVYGKSLPFKGWRSKYFTEGKFVNMVQTDNVSSIIKSLDYAEKNGFAMAVVDDYQFVAGMKMIRDAKIKGYDKFTDIAQGFVAVTDYVKSMKSKIVVVFLSHTEDDGFGGTKAKTAGKMIDNVIGLESLYTTVLGVKIIEGAHYFTTKTNGADTVKSPEGMFDTDKIPNDLQLVYNKIMEYNYGESETETGKPVSLPFQNKVTGDQKSNNTDTNNQVVQPLFHAAEETTETKPSAKPEFLGFAPVENQGPDGGVPIITFEAVTTDTVAEKKEESKEEPKKEPEKAGVPDVQIVAAAEPIIEKAELTAKEKADAIISCLGGAKKALPFLIKKKSITMEENLHDIEELRINRLYNNIPKLLDIMRKEGAI